MSGRNPFKGGAPQGYRIRMMEPGEAVGLARIEAAADRLLVEAGHLAEALPTPAEHFVAFLLRHEVFVAVHKASEAPVGFAAAASLSSLLGEDEGTGEEAECYWLSGMAVDPEHGRGLGSALLSAVVARAGWFLHRAVGLSTARDVPFNEPFYAGRGFVAVPPEDRTQGLHKRFGAELPPGVDPARRTVMIRWL